MGAVRVWARSEQLIEDCPASRARTSKTDLTDPGPVRSDANIFYRYHDYYDASFDFGAAMSNVRNTGEAVNIHRVLVPGWFSNG